MCMEAMSTVFDVVYQTSGQRKTTQVKYLNVCTGIIVKILGRKTVAKIVLDSSESA